MYIIYNVYYVSSKGILIKMRVFYFMKIPIYQLIFIVMFSSHSFGQTITYICITILGEIVHFMKYVICHEIRNFTKRMRDI